MEPQSGLIIKQSEIISQLSELCKETIGLLSQYMDIEKYERELENIRK